jgi:DHA1 family inner membrane transport protein
MAFFRSKTVNLLHLHYGIHALALSGGGAFFAVYLLKSGVSAPWVLGTFAAILAGRFVVRPLVVPIAIRTGLRAIVIAGGCLTALQYPILAEVQGLSPALYILIATAAIGEAFYWTGFHAYYAALGTEEHRGSELGAREALAALIGIVNPLVTGLILVAYGPRVAFGVTTVLLLLGTLPLLFTPDVAVERHVKGVYRTALPGVKLFMADGWIGAGCFIVWKIALFVTLGQGFVAFGGALASAALVGAVGSLVLGRLIDTGGGRKAVAYAIGAMAVVIIARAAAPGHVALAVFANALGALAICLYVPTLMTAVYNQAQRSACTLRFHVATEGGWDAGGAAGCLIAALLAGAGVPLSVPILLSLLGAGWAFTQLRHYYATHRALAEVAVDPLAQNAIVNLAEEA